MFLITNSYAPLSFTFHTLTLQMITKLMSDMPTHKKGVGVFIMFSTFNSILLYVKVYVVNEGVYRKTTFSCRGLKESDTFYTDAIDSEPKKVRETH